MSCRSVLLLSVLLIGCPSRDRRPAAAHASAVAVASAGPRGAQPAASRAGSTQAPAALPRVENRDGLRGLLASLGEVVKVELVRLEPGVAAEKLPSAHRDHLLELLRDGALTDTRTATSPPWDAILLFYTRSSGTYAATLVGHSTLRLHPGPTRNFEGDAARWNDSPPPEVVLNDERGWLWEYLESRLGATKQKEYLAPKHAPDYLEHPLRP